jgi:SpoIIAA-like
MIELLHDLPDGVIGLRASDQVTADDYRDAMVPALEEALARGGVRLLYVLDAHAKFSPGALFADAKLGVGHLTGWERLAVVSDADWLEHMIKAFGWMMPGEVQAFEGDRIDQAKAWLSRPSDSTAG